MRSNVKRRALMVAHPNGIIELFADRSAFWKTLNIESSRNFIGKMKLPRWYKGMYIQWAVIQHADNLDARMIKKYQKELLHLD